jgi:hypothetical protein
MRERPHRCAALSLLAALGVGCGDGDGDAVRQVPADGGFDDRATQGMVDAPAPAPGAITPNLGRFVPVDDPSLRALLVASSGRSPEYPGAIARDLDGDGEPEIFSFSDLGWALLTRTAGAWRVAQRGPEPVRTAGFCERRSRIAAA